MLFKILREGRTAYVHSYWLVEIVEGWVLGSDEFSFNLIAVDVCVGRRQKAEQGREERKRTDVDRNTQ